MTKIVGVIQVKGGVGRSTIATNLAAVFAMSQPTMLIDCDMPQGTSSSWFALRQSGGASKNLDLATAVDHVELVRAVKACAGNCRYIVIDGPPRLAEMTRAIMMLSDLSIIPLGASAAEIWSTSDLLGTLAEARGFKPSVDARIVWTRFRVQTREARDLQAGVQSELKLRELSSRLGYRVAYSEALARGLSADEWLDRNAHAEVRALAKEVAAILAEKKR